VGVGSFEQGTFVNGKGVEFLPYVPDFQRVLAGDTSVTGWQVGGITLGDPTEFRALRHTGRVGIEVKSESRRPKSKVPEPAISSVGLFIGLGVFFLGKKSLNR
jgi:hypothetical protein